MRNFSLLTVSLLSGFLIASRADANPIVFSNLGPGGTYDGSSGWIVGEIGHDFDQATSFVVNTTAKLDFLELGVGFEGGTNALTVWLMTDDGGLPRTIIESFQLFNVPTFGSSSTLLTTATSALHPWLLTATVYWVAVSATQPQSLFAWNWNVTGDLGIAGRIDEGPWVANGTPGGLAPLAGALRVTAVSEPISILLFATSVAAVSLRHRRVTRARFDLRNLNAPPQTSDPDAPNVRRRVRSSCSTG